MDAEAVDRGLELRPPVELGLTAPPVVLGSPIGNELLQLRERRPLLPGWSGLVLRPAGVRETLSQIGERLIRGPIVEGNRAIVTGQRARRRRGEDERARARRKQVAPRRFHGSLRYLWA